MTYLPDALPDGSEYDPATETLTIPVDIDDGDIPQAVVLGVEALSEETVTSLDPLAAAVDPDSLNDLFEERPSAPQEQAWVSFPYQDHRVTVYNQGHLEIEPQDRDGP